MTADLYYEGDDSIILRLIEAVEELRSDGRAHRPGCPSTVSIEWASCCPPAIKEPTPCPRCDGKGTIDLTAEDYGLALEGSTEAWAGDDSPGTEDCDRCDGTGIIAATEEPTP